MKPRAAIGRFGPPLFPGARAVCAAACATAVCGAALRAAEDAAPGGSLTARLEFREHVERGPRATGLAVPLESTREVEFKKEPTYAPGQVRRGLLQVGPAPHDVIGFTWESGARKLYLDLNRDLDLTNDPDGVFAAAGPYFEFQSFPQVGFDLETGGVARRYVVAAVFSSGFDGHSFTLRSGWAATLELGGQRHEIALQDNLDGTIGGGDELCIGPDDKPQIRQAVRFPRLLWLGGTVYRVSGQFESEGRVGAVRLRLDRVEMPLGTLDLADAGVEELVIHGACTAILRPPDTSARLPAGEYVVRTVQAQHGLYASSFGPPVSFRIEPDETTRLPIGGPLRPVVNARPRGGTLVLDYRLLGQGGEEYSARELGPAPELEIRKGDRILASDSFEFG